MSDTGPGKRLTTEQEQQGADLYAAGASERDVAEALGCSASTAHRLRLRLAQEAAPAAPAATVPAEPDTAEAPGTPEPGEAADALSALRAQRAAQASVVEGLEQRQATSLQAMATLKQEQLGELAEGRANVGLRQRYRNAEDDAQDWATAAGLARDKLHMIDQRIADLEARQHLARMRGELALAVGDRAAAVSATGDRQRGAVLAMRDSAAEFVQAVADERAACQRVEDLAAAVTAAAVHLGEPVPDIPPATSTALWLHPDEAGAGGALALHRAINRAREGNAQAAAVHLGEAFGWLPPDPAAIAAERERLLAMRAQQAAPAAEPHEPWTRPDTSTIDLDAAGRELPAWRVRPHPATPIRARRPGGLRVARRAALAGMT